MWKNNRLWVVVSLISVIFSILLNLVRPAFGIKFAVYLGLAFLILTILPNNLLSLTKGSVKTLLARLFSFRRDFGIIAGLLFATHAIMSGAFYGKFQFSFYGKREIIIGVLALVIFYALLFTSSKWSRRVLKSKWDLLHKLVWVAVSFGLVHSILAKGFYENELPVLAILGFGVIILVSIIQLFQKKWLHLGLVITGLVVANLVLFILFPTSYSGSENNSNSSSSTNQSVSSNSGGSKQISTSDLKNNKTASSCYVSYEKKVYNMSGYLSTHPGGRGAILRYCGQEIDSFSAEHPGGNFSDLLTTMKPFYIGDLV